MQGWVDLKKLHFYCRPLLAAKECAIEMMTECGVFESETPQIRAALEQLRLASDVINFVCRDRVDGTH